MTACTVRATGAMARAATIVIDTSRTPAARGDGGRGDALVAVGRWIDARLEAALVPVGAFAAVYFAGHLVVAWGRGLF